MKARTRMTCKVSRLPEVTTVSEVAADTETTTVADMETAKAEAVVTAIAKAGEASAIDKAAEAVTASKVAKAATLSVRNTLLKNWPMPAWRCRLLSLATTSLPRTCL